MAKVRNHIYKQINLILANEYFTYFYVFIFVLLPLLSWVSLTITALVTLRKGFYFGFKALIVAGSTFICVSLLSSPVMTAIANGILIYLPCFLAALILRYTSRWELTASFILLLGLIGVLLVQWLAPTYILAQYDQIITYIFKLSAENPGLAPIIKTADQNNKLIFANYLFGLQILTIALNTIIPLMIARSVQAALYYPGGFRKEMLTFRASPFWVFFLIWITLGCYLKQPIAINSMPLMATYFGLAGFGTLYNFLNKYKYWFRLILLLMPLLAMPLVMAPIYIFMGAIDSIFNLRGHLPQGKLK